MADLATAAQLQLFLGESQDAALMAQLVSAASRAAEQFCSRTFTQTVYSAEPYNGPGTQKIFLRQAPVASVQLLQIFADDLTTPITVPPAPSSNQGFGYTFDSAKGFLYLIGGSFTRGIQNVQLSYTAGYADGVVTNEAVNIPSVASGGKYQATLLQGTTLRAMTSLTFVVGGAALTQVGSNPVTGQYTLSAGGVLTFAAADAGKALLASYTTLGYPADLSQAVVEIAAQKYALRRKMGLKSEGMAGQSIVFDKSGIPEAAKLVLDQYKRPFMML